MANIKPLFGKSEEGSLSQIVLSKPLVEFRAGKMNRAINSKLVIPDDRKGMVQIRRGEDGLMHFIWKERTSDKFEDDLIIFPDDIEFTRVSQCTTGRVYVLKFKSSPRRMFFWMQEPIELKDKMFCNRVNQYLNKLPVTETENKDEADMSASTEETNDSTDMRSILPEELSSLLGNLNPEQLTQLAGSGIIGEAASALGIPGGNISSLINASPPTTNNETTRDSKRSADAVQLSDLQSILSGIKVPKTESEPAINLEKGLTPEVIAKLIKNPKFLDAAKNTLPPFEGEIENEVRSTVISPQFQQAIAQFSAGLQSGQLAPVISQFDLGDAAIAAATAGDMAAFVKAIEESEKAIENDSNDVDMEQ